MEGHEIKKCKYCPKECRYDEADNFFFRRTESPDGYQYHCKVCAKERVNEYRRRTSEERKLKRKLKRIEMREKAKEAAIKAEEGARLAKIADEESIREFNERAEREGWGDA